MEELEKNTSLKKVEVIFNSTLSRFSPGFSCILNNERDEQVKYICLNHNPN